MLLYKRVKLCSNRLPKLEDNEIYSHPLLLLISSATELWWNLRNNSLWWKDFELKPCFYLRCSTKTSIPWSKKHISTWKIGCYIVLNWSWKMKNHDFQKQSFKVYSVMLMYFLQIFKNLVFSCIKNIVNLIFGRSMSQTSEWKLLFTFLIL